MLLGLATCASDYQQAVRLVKWMGFLSERHGGSLSHRHLLLSISSDISGETIVDLANRIFARVTPIVLDESGAGWPGAANEMLISILRAADEPVLFLEPDAILITHDGLDKIETEYGQNGKPFMGGYVPTPPPHMTGIGVYPPNWEVLVPKLARIPESAGWDTYCAEEIAAHCHFTPLIQHIFRRHEPGWSIPSLNALDPRAVIFHQDKRGKLIRMLDEARYENACAQHSIFSYVETKETAMTRFYLTANATRPVFTSLKKFMFDPIAAFAGSTPGVYATDIVTEQLALSDVSLNPTSGVSEITQAQYEERTKKKWLHPVLRTLQPSNVTLNRAARPPVGPLSATPSRQAAEVVEGRSTGAGDDPLGIGPVKDINEILKVDTVVPSQPAPIGGRKQRPRIKGVTV